MDYTSKYIIARAAMHTTAQPSSQIRLVDWIIRTSTPRYAMLLLCRGSPPPPPPPNGANHPSPRKNRGSKSPPFLRDPTNVKTSTRYIARHTYLSCAMRRQNTGGIMCKEGHYIYIYFRACFVYEKKSTGGITPNKRQRPYAALHRTGQHNTAKHRPAPPSIASHRAALLTQAPSSSTHGHIDGYVKPRLGLWTDKTGRPLRSSNPR